MLAEAERAGGRPGTLLADALTAVQAGETNRALLRLAEVWVHTRSPELSALILAVPGEQAGVDWSSAREDRETAWARVWATRPSARTSLIALPWPRSWRAAMQRVEAIDTHPDPRAGDALLALQNRFETDASWQLWALVTKVLAEQGEERHRPFASAITPRVHAPSPAFTAFLRDGPPVPLPLANPALLASLRGHLVAHATSVDLPTLLAAIYADPDDDMARLIYADALTEAGDPRGEFIHLQMRPDDPLALQRAAVLLRKHGHAWVDGVDVGLHREGRVFERGFLVGGVWDDVGDSLAHPAWGLVECLSAGERTGFLARAVLSGRLPRLRRLYGVHHSAIARLSQGPQAPRLTHLGILLEDATIFPTSSGFSSVIELSLKHPVDRRFPEGLLGQWPNVRRWVFRHPYDQVGALLDWCPPPSVKEVVNATNFGALLPKTEGWVFTLRRSRDGRMRRVTAHWGGGQQSQTTLVIALRSIRAVESLEITTTRGLRGAPRDVADREVQRLRGHWTPPA